MSFQRSSTEWLHQRYTAIIVLLTIIGLSAFGKYILISNFTSLHNCLHTMQSWALCFENFFIGTQKVSLLTFFKSPFNTVVALSATTAALYHGAIGMKIILEDYISSNSLCKTLSTCTFFITYLAIGLFVLTVITLHIKANIA